LNSSVSNLLVFVSGVTRASLRYFTQIGDVLVARLDRHQVRNMAALLTILMHVIILGPLAMSGGNHGTRAPLARHAVTNAMQADSGEYVSTVMFFTDHTAMENRHRNAIHPPSSLAAQEPKPTADMLEMIEVPPLQISADEDMRQAVTSSIDPAERAITFVRYMGEITSRIERSWTLPNKSLDIGFHCRVQILRDEVGTVKEVTLQRCDAQPEIRLSVVQAIQNASPLPTLPGVSAFSESLTLDFNAETEPTNARRTSVQPASDDS